MKLPNDGHVRFAGIATLRQQSETANGTMSIGLKDETGNIQVVVWSSLEEKQCS